MKYLLGSLLLTLFMAKPAADKPNFVVILVDDMYYTSMGYTGCKVIETPHLDELCELGRFSPQGYVSHGVCAPSRAGLMTGRYQARFGYETLSGGVKHALEVRHGMDLNEKTIADILKPAGYVSGAFGKWHMGENEEFLPLRRGFDHHLHLAGAYLPEGKRMADSHLLLNGRELPWPVDSEGKTRYKTDIMTDHAVEWMKKVASKKPFFLYFSTNAVHAPIVAPRGREKDGIHPYVGMMENLDDNIGRLLKTLDGLNIRDNTMVIFLNDNGGGGAIKDAGVLEQINNLPYRGGKAQTYEGGVRVPFAVHWPGRIEGKDYPGVITAFDILPTLAAAAGVELPKDREFDGVDMIPFLTGEKEPLTGRKLMWRWRNGYAIRKGKWKLVWSRDFKKHFSALKRENLKPRKTDRPDPRDRHRGFFLEPELYDLEADPGESNDLAERHPEIVRELKKELEAFDAIAKPPLERELEVSPQKP